MALQHGPPQPPPHDSFDEAVVRANRDFDRLRHLHSANWELTLSGNVVWRCACSLGTVRSTNSMEIHVKEAVRKERGPVRPPAKR